MQTDHADPYLDLVPEIHREPDPLIEGAKLLFVRKVKLFELAGQRSMDDRIVYDISVKPKSRLETAFVGRVAVLDEEFGLLEVDLTPVETITSSIPIPIFEYWLPRMFAQAFTG